MKIRTLTNEDIPQLKKIWKDTFHDTDHFIDWYFENRYFPEVSVCAEENDMIVAVCHTMPCVQYLRGRELSAALLNGVATLPQYRGRGIMKQLILALYDILTARGIYLMPNTPVDLRIYAPCGHFPATDAVVIDRAEQKTMPADISVKQLDSALDTIFPLYTDIAPGYSGMLKRNKAEFSRKCSEYQADGAEVLLHNNGYAIIAAAEDSCICCEIIARDTLTYHSLLEALFAYAWPKKLTAKLPSAAFLDHTAVPRSVLGILNVQNVLQTMNFNIPLTIEISDPFYPQNSGRYSLNADAPSDHADVSLSIGSFVEWISGYKNITDTDAVFHTDCAALFPQKQLCFTNDDY